jgi:hypothetical protein
MRAKEVISVSVPGTGIWAGNRGNIIWPSSSTGRGASHQRHDDGAERGMELDGAGGQLLASGHLQVRGQRHCSHRRKGKH